MMIFRRTAWSPSIRTTWQCLRSRRLKQSLTRHSSWRPSLFPAADVTPTPTERTCCPIGTFRSPDRTELAKLALDYISFSISSGHKVYAQVPTEDEMRNIQCAKSRADAARRGKLDDIIKELLREDM